MLMLLGFALAAILFVGPMRREDSATHPTQQLPECSVTSLESLQEAFDVLDHAVNEGKGYKDFPKSCWIPNRSSSGMV